MPVALIVFGDKSHTDLHRALLLTPIIFTMTLFNQSACNNAKFWRPIGYIPNLSYGKGTADRTSTTDKIQDEHTCLSCTFQLLCRISKDGGFNLVVLGEEVHIKVWIHYFIEDAKGNNKWLGQNPGNREGVQQPYCDCKCYFEQLSNTNPACEYITLNDIHEDKRHKRNDEDEGKHYFKPMPRYDIDNALLDKYMPLSDHIHGPLKMMPSELLHTSGSGLIMYMFKSLRQQIGGGKDRVFIDQEHVIISNIIKHQSEWDFPRGSMRNRLIDETKCQSSKRKSNLFCLMCIANTTNGKNVLKNSLNLSDSR
jgi:hypothetical protein